MKAVIQRVLKSKVEVDNKVIGSIEKGLLVLFGTHKDDTEDKIDPMALKIVNMRIFSDENDKMNLSVKDIEGSILVVSQFTLLADTKKGNRPSFINSMEPNRANEFYERFIDSLKGHIKKVESGEFGANMQVSMINDGPVTIVLET